MSSILAFIMLLGAKVLGAGAKMQVWYMKPGDHVRIEGEREAEAGVDCLEGKVLKVHKSKNRVLVRDLIQNKTYEVSGRDISWLDKKEEIPRGKKLVMCGRGGRLYKGV